MFVERFAALSTVREAFVDEKMFSRSRSHSVHSYLIYIFTCNFLGHSYVENTVNWDFITQMLNTMLSTHSH